MVDMKVIDVKRVTDLLKKWNINVHICVKSIMDHLNNLFAYNIITQNFCNLKLWGDP